MATTKKLIPFDYTKARGGAKVKCADGTEITIVTFTDFDKDAEIIGVIENPGYIDVLRFSRDGNVRESSSKFPIDFNKMLTLEVDDIDFFPSKNPQSGPVANWELAFQSCKERAHILTKERDALRVENNLKIRDMAEIRKQRDKYHDDILKVEKELDELKEERNALRDWQRAAIARRTHFYKCLKAWEDVRPGEPSL